VVKNTLTTRALTGTPMEELSEHFAGPTAIAYAEDMVAPAKVLKEFSKEFGKLEFKMGYVDGQVVDSDGVSALADLPDRDQLVAIALAGLQAPITGLVRVLNANLTGLVTVVDRIAKQKGEAA
jgi:large subunit ribosomal protein L10